MFTDGVYSCHFNTETRCLDCFIVSADRSATARTTTFVEPCSHQTKKNVPKCTCHIFVQLHWLHWTGVKNTSFRFKHQTQRYAIKYSEYGSPWKRIRENVGAAPRFTTAWRNRWSTWPIKTSKVFTVLSKPRNHNPRPTLRCLLHVSKVFCPPFMYLTADFHSQSRPDKASFGSFHSRRSYSNVSNSMVAVEPCMVDFASRFAAGNKHRCQAKMYFTVSWFAWRVALACRPKAGLLAQFMKIVSAECATLTKGNTKDASIFKTSPAFRHVTCCVCLSCPPQHLSSSSGEFCLRCDRKHCQAPSVNTTWATRQVSISVFFTLLWWSCKAKTSDVISQHRWMVEADFMGKSTCYHLVCYFFVVDRLLLFAAFWRIAWHRNAVKFDLAMSHHISSRTFLPAHLTRSTDPVQPQTWLIV